jgi:coatomer subunit beta'
VYWSDNGETVVIACEASFYILKYNKDVVASYVSSGAEAEDGIEDAFQMVNEISER